MFTPKGMTPVYDEAGVFKYYSSVQAPASSMPRSTKLPTPPNRRGTSLSKIAKQYNVDVNDLYKAILATNRRDKNSPVSEETVLAMAETVAYRLASEGSYYSESDLEKVVAHFGISSTELIGLVLQDVWLSHEMARYSSKVLSYEQHIRKLKEGIPL